MSRLLFCDKRLLAFLDFSVVADELDSGFSSQIAAQILCGDSLLDGVNFHLILLGKLGILGIKLLVGNLDLFKLDDLLKSETDLDLMGGLISHALANSRHIAAGELDVIFQGDTLHLQTITEIVDVLVDAVLDHSGGDVSVKLVGQSLEELIVNSAVGAVGSSLLQLDAHISLVLVHGLELGVVLDKLVIGLGKLGSLDGVELALEYCGLAGQFFGVILLGEGDIYVKLVVDGMSDDLILKTGDEIAGAQLELIAFGLAALKSDIVDKAFKIKDDLVAVLTGTVIDVDEAAVLLEKLVQLSVDVLVGNCGGGLVQNDALIIVELDFGLDGDDSRELQTVLADSSDIQIDLVVDIFKTALVDSGLQSNRIEIVDSVFIEELFAVELLDNAAGSLALTETGNGKLMSVLAICFGTGLGEILGAHFDLKLLAVYTGIGAADKTHGCYPPKNKWFAYYIIISYFAVKWNTQITYNDGKKYKIYITFNY